MATSDPAAEVRGRIAAALDRTAGLARLTIAGFAVTVLLLLLVLGGLLSVTTDTRAAVRDRAILEDRNAELEETNAQLEDVTGQATDWIVRLSEQLRAAGEPVPDIVIRPTTSTTVP